MINSPIERTYEALDEICFNSHKLKDSSTFNTFLDAF